MWSTAFRAADLVDVAQDDGEYPAFLSDINGGWQTPDSFYTVAVVGVLAVGAGVVVKRFRQARD